MKICAVMQPYIFPYIGYYQLVYAADYFILYDDVTFIKQSYINRNSILVSAQAKLFSLPVLGASSNVLIKDLSYGSADKLLKTIKQSYCKAPYYKDVIDLISSTLTNDVRSISKINYLSVHSVFKYLGIEKKIIFSSELDYDRTAEREERLVALTKMHGCNNYVNSPGGKALYEKEYFAAKDIKLSFIESKISHYKQATTEFIPYLSIIDILMYCSKSEIVKMLNNYELD